VLWWVRAKDPPCPWNEATCSWVGAYPRPLLSST